ncbi:MAG: MarC family NAAT transporter [Duodenibacillus sp.]|nr:MarC family NAAT transporter [Duodenibacillus sp.]
MQPDLLTHYFWGAFVSLIVMANPLSKIPLFITLTSSMSPAERKTQAHKAGFYTFLVMLASLLAGNIILAFFGISYGALRIAGGLVVAITGAQMLFLGQKSPNAPPPVAHGKDDYAFFPLAMPGTAGPGTIAVLIGFSSKIAEVPSKTEMISAFIMTGIAIAAVSAIVWVTMLASDYCSRILGASGTQVLSKLMGFLLICIGVQFIGSGIRTFVAGS